MYTHIYIIYENTFISVLLQIILYSVPSMKQEQDTPHCNSTGSSVTLLADALSRRKALRSNSEQLDGNITTLFRLENNEICQCILKYQFEKSSVRKNKK